MNQSKAEILRIRASTLQKQKLAEAAEQVIADQTVVRVAAEEYDWLVAKKEEPRRDLPKLRELLTNPSVFEQ